MREVLLSFSINLLKTVTPSLRGLLLPYIKHAVLSEDDTELPLRWLEGLAQG